MSIKIKGYLLGIIASASYGLNPLFALPLYSDGMNADSVLLFRYLFAVVIVGAMLRIRGHHFSVSPKEILLLSILGIMTALSSLSLFLAYNYVAAGIASTLLFIYPMIVAIIMAIVYKEKLTMQTILCILAAGLGIMLLYKTTDGGTLDTFGILLSFASALTYAIYLVGVNHRSLKEMPTLKIIFYVLLSGVFLFIIRLLFFVPLTMPHTAYHWFNLLALAVFPTTVSFLCTTKAISYIGSTPTAILGALEPLTAVIIGILVFNELLTTRIAIGLILIIAAVTLVISGSNITKQLIRIRKLFPRNHPKSN